MNSFGNGTSAPIPTSAADKNRASIINNASPDGGTNGETRRPVVCVFCGASSGNLDIYMQTARDIAKLLFEHDASLVYGGGTSGLMGEVAKTFVELTGDPSRVHGIIPQALQKYEQENNPIDESVFGHMEIVQSMHARKLMMAKEVCAGGKGSGFIALSGGFGTLEEAAEMTTWNQLGMINVPVIALNINGYWDGLFEWSMRAVESGFIKPLNRDILVEVKTPEAAIKALKDYVPSPERFECSWDLL